MRICMFRKESRTLEEGLLVNVRSQAVNDGWSYGGRSATSRVRFCCSSLLDRYGSAMKQQIWMSA